MKELNYHALTNSIKKFYIDVCVNICVDILVSSVSKWHNEIWLDIYVKKNYTKFYIDV